MPWTRTQATGSNLGSVTSGTLAYGSNNTAGSLLVASIRGGTVPDTLGISDSQGNTWVAHPDGVATDGTASGNDTNEAFYCLNCKAGANTITATQNQSGHGLRVVIEEYAPPSGVASLVDHGSVSTTSTTATSSTVSTNGTATSINDLVYGVLGMSSGQTITIGSGYTISATDAASNANAGGQRITSQWKTATAGGTQTSTDSWASGASYAAQILCFTTAAAVPAIPLVTRGRRDVWKPAEFYEAFRSVLLVKRLSGLLEARIVGMESFEKWVGRQRAWA